MSEHPDYITLPLTAHQAALVVVVVGLLLASLAIYGVLRAMSSDKRRRLIEELGELQDLAAALILLFFLAALVAAAAVLFDTVCNVFWPPEGTQPGPNLGAGALIAALLGAPFVIWATYIRHRTLFFQREGQITDRISKAVEQLGAEKTVKKHLENSVGKRVFEKQDDGSPDYSRPVLVETSERNIEVRIGGLLSLERISQDSVKHDNGRDHVRVMEILCAYVRNNAPASEAAVSLREKYEEATTATADAPPMTDEQFMESEGIPGNYDLEDYISPRAIAHWARSLPKPREDIQLALTIIGRRDADQRRCEARWGGDAAAEWVFDDTPPELPDSDEPVGPDAFEAFKAALAAWKDKLGAYRGYRPDLRGTGLQGADLSGLALGGARLDRARLEGANLGGARMEGANLSEARMQGAVLEAARMQGANLGGARMEGAVLGEARMQGAFLRGARMEGANLGGARMEGANLSEARMGTRTSLRRRLHAGSDRVSLRRCLGDPSRNPSPPRALAGLATSFGRRKRLQRPTGPMARRSRPLQAPSAAGGLSPYSAASGWRGGRISPASRSSTKKAANWARPETPDLA